MRMSPARRQPSRQQTMQVMLTVMFTGSISSRDALGARALPAESYLIGIHSSSYITAATEARPLRPWRAILVGARERFLMMSAGSKSSRAEVVAASRRRLEELARRLRRCARPPGRGIPRRADVEATPPPEMRGVTTGVPPDAASREGRPGAERSTTSSSRSRCSTPRDPGRRPHEACAAGTEPARADRCERGVAWRGQS